MRIYPISVRTSYNSQHPDCYTNQTVKNVKVSNQNFKGTAGSLTGFCFGSITGMAATIGLSFIGVCVTLPVFLAGFLLGAGGGSYGCNKLGVYIDKKISNMDKK